MFRLFSYSLLAIIAVGVCGCTPKVNVVKTNGDDCVKGMRYYRPKPYLFIAPADATLSEETLKTEAATDKPASTKTTKKSGVTDLYVSMQLQYLPDFSEEYAIDVTPGWGKADVDIKLENGWNLTGLNQNIDSKVSENLTAFAEVLKGAGGLITTGNKIAGESPQGLQVEKAEQRWVVKATNIPLGYYESVFTRCPDGGRTMLGWRYVGFSPFGSAVSQGCSGDDLGGLYGIVFEKGVMTFRRLDVVRGYEAEPWRNEMTRVNSGVITYKTANGGGGGAKSAADIIKAVKDAATKSVAQGTIVRITDDPIEDNKYSLVITHNGILSDDNRNAIIAAINNNKGNLVFEIFFRQQPIDPSESMPDQTNFNNRLNF